MNEEFKRDEQGAEEFGGVHNEETQANDFPGFAQEQEQETPVEDIYSGEYEDAPAEEIAQEVAETPEYQPQEAVDYPEPEIRNEPQPEPDYGAYQQPAAPYYTPNNYNQYQPNPVQPAPVQEPTKSNKGLKIFAIIVTALLLVAIGVCAFVIGSYSEKPAKGNETVTGSSEENVDGNTGDSDGPDLVIGETPESSGSTASGVLSASSIYEKAKEYNVGIVVYARNSSANVAGEGTGILMGTDGDGKYTYIITCAHVISDAGISVRVQTADGTTYDAEIVGFDTRTDLGVIKIKASGLPVAEFGDSTKLKVGDPVYAIGNPGGVEFFGSFTGGYVSAIERPVSSEIGYTMNCIQHDAAINPGNSGGMLVNQYGQVVGINSQKIAATDYEGMGFAIPISDAMPIINDLIDYSYVPNRPKLGITYYPVSASSQYSMIAQINGLPAGTLIIDEIDSQSTLSGTGVRQYDMIIAVNGKDLTSADILLELIDDGKVGDKLTLTIARINSDYSVSKFDVTVTLVEDKNVPEKEETTQSYYVDPFGESEYDFFFGY